MTPVTPALIRREEEAALSSIFCLRLRYYIIAVIVRFNCPEQGGVGGRRWAAGDVPRQLLIVAHLSRPIHPFSNSFSILFDL